MDDGMNDTWSDRDLPEDKEERIQYLEEMIQSMKDREVAEMLEYAFSIDKLVSLTNLEEIV